MTEHQHADPKAAAERENEIHQGTFPGQAGVNFIEVSAEKVSAKMEVRPDLLQPYGFVHGGAFVTLADTCASVASVQGLPKDRTALTVQLSINYVASVKTGVLFAEAVAIHRGRTSMVYETKVTNDAGRLMALVTTSHLVVNYA